MSEPEKPTLLIVDDDPAIRALLVRIGERSGFQVDTAKDGMEALEMLERKNYMIAVVDLMMPRVSGYEVVQRVSTLQPRPTVIVATAMTNSDVASLDDSLVRRVIRKPFDIDAVAQALIESARQIVDERVKGQTPPPDMITITLRDTATTPGDATPEPSVVAPAPLDEPATATDDPSAGPPPPDKSHH